MNGPSHYRAAEKLLAGADNPNHHPEWAALSVARAQVHATLALTAATIERLRKPEHSARQAWTELTQ